jgi:hypothetical protein
MDLNTIAARTGLPPRRLRYVMEHGVLPGLRQRPRGYGLDWTFTDFEAFGIALAGVLLNAGLRRDAVAACLDEVVGKFGRDVAIADIPLYRAYTGKPSTLTIADGLAVRLIAAGRKGVTAGGVDTGWLPIGPDAPDPDATPVVRVEVDLVALRNRLTA